MKYEFIHFYSCNVLKFVTIIIIIIIIITIKKKFKKKIQGNLPKVRTCRKTLLINCARGVNSHTLRTEKQ